MKLTKTAAMLGFIVLLALVLRIIAANYVNVSTDEMIYSILPLNIMSAGRLGTVEQSPLAFYLNDFSYMIFGGISPISIRLPGILFGAASVVLIFLLSLQLVKDKTAAYGAALLFTFSGYALINNVEMDMAAFFFALLSIYFFIRSLDDSWYLYLASVSLALGILIKNLVALVIPAYLIILLIKAARDKKANNLTISKPMIKRAVAAAAIGLLILAPIFVYNYMTYNYLGITDYYFSNILGIGKSVHTGLENAPWALTTLKNVTINTFKESFAINWLLIILGIVGFAIAIRRNWFEIISIVLPAAFIYMYTAGVTGSQSHFLMIPMVASICAAFTLTQLKVKIPEKYLISSLLVLLLISSAFVLNGVRDSYKESLTLQLRSAVREHIPDDAVVIIDPRIYRGIHAWVFNDKHYLDGTYWQEFSRVISQTSGKQVTLPLFYIECGKGKYCGWKPEDYERVNPLGQQLTAFFTNETTKVAEVFAVDLVLLHKGTITLPEAAIPIIDRTHTFWFYPVGWKNTDEVIDNYTPKGFDKILNAFGFFILYIDLLLALCAIPLVIKMAMHHEN